MLVFAENGEIVAPIENMRFDDTIYNILDNLESVTKNFNSYRYGNHNSRSFGGIECPGIY